MAAGLYPGVHAQWDRRVPAAPVRIDIAGFVGLAERGPVGAVGAVESWPQFVALYGDFQRWAWMAYAVRAFFDNGGRRLHIARVVGPTRATTTTGVQPADGSASIVADVGGFRASALATLEQRASAVTAGVQPPDRRSSIVGSVAGFVPGAIVTLRQAGVAPIRLRLVSIDIVGSRLFWDRELSLAFDFTLPIRIDAITRDERLIAALSGPTVTWDRPLDARFDLAAPLAIAAGAGVASAVLPDESGDDLLSVSAASPGRWGNRLSVRVTTSFSAEIATRPLLAPDPADLLTLARVDGLAPGSLVEIRQDGIAPVRRELVAVDRAAARVTLAAALAGFDLAAAANGSNPILLRRLAFALSVSEDGRLVETHTDCDLPAASDHPVNSASARIRIAHAGAAGARWLDPGSAMLEQGRALLGGGRDGIATLGVDDLLGRADLPPSGLRLFEALSETAALALPDLHLPDRQPAIVAAPPPPVVDPCDICAPADPAPALPTGAAISEGFTAFVPDAVLYAQSALVEHCEALGNRVALLDPPPYGSDGTPFSIDALLGWRRHFDTSYAACYFPWPAATDPLAKIAGTLRIVPPCGHAAGQFAAADERAGHNAPANQPLAWVSALPVPFDDVGHAFLNDNGINAILARPGRGIRIMGARTLSSRSDWQQLVVRRLLLRLKRSLHLALAWAVFEPNEARLDERVVALIEGLLDSEWQAGRLIGSTPDEAYFVAVERDAAAVDNGEFVVTIGIAPAHPAEFVHLRLTRTLDRLELAEETARSGWPS